MKEASAFLALKMVHAILSGRYDFDTFVAARSAADKAIKELERS